MLGAEQPIYTAHLSKEKTTEYSPMNGIENTEAQVYQKTRPGSIIDVESTDLQNSNKMMSGFTFSPHTVKAKAFSTNAISPMMRNHPISVKQFLK